MPLIMFDCKTLLANIITIAKMMEGLNIATKLFKSYLINSDILYSLFSLKVLEMNFFPKI